LPGTPLALLKTNRGLKLPSGLKLDIMKRGTKLILPGSGNGFFKKISRLLELTRWGYG
jgi:hypothetical protein